MAKAASSAIATHEQVCAQRWLSTMSAMKDIKAILAWGAAGVMGAMGTIIILLLNRLPH